MATEKPVKAYLGQVADTSLRDVISYSAEADIPIGLPVMRGTNKDRQVIRFNGGVTNEMVGVAVRSQQCVGSYSATYPQPYYPAKSTVGVLQKGRIHVPIYGLYTIVVGDTAYIDTLYDHISNVPVPNQTVPIGRFLTGGSTVDGDILFELELIPGFAEKPLVETVNEEGLKNDNLKNVKKSKK